MRATLLGRLASPMAVFFYAKGGYSAMQEPMQVHDAAVRAHRNN